jgi:copper homeostasis protein
VVERDIRAVRELEAGGIAIGFLDADGTIDRERTARAAEIARPLEVTCHRAFDLTRDPEEALETLVSLGIDRVLTSGHAPDVAAGIETLQRLVTLAGDRITIMPGGGVTEDNLATIVRATGAREIHFSGSIIRESPMPQHNSSAPLGSSRSLGASEIRLTDPARLQRMISSLR